MLFRSVCRTSGKLATEECRQDPEGNKAYAEYFRSGTVPSEYCDLHIKVAICNATGKRATENCQDKSEKVFITRKDAETNGAWRTAADAKYMAPIEICEQCQKAPEPTPTPTPDPNSNTNTNNNANSNTNKNNTNTNTNKNNTNTNTNKNNTNTNTNSNKNNTNTNTH